VSRRQFFKTAILLTSSLLIKSTFDHFAILERLTGSGVLKSALAPSPNDNEILAHLPVFPQVGWIYGDIRRQNIEWSPLIGFDETDNSPFGPERLAETVALNHPVVYRACQDFFQNEINLIDQSTKQPRMGEAVKKVFDICYQLTDKQSVQAAIEATIFTLTTVYHFDLGTDEAIKKFHLTINHNRRQSMSDDWAENFLSQRPSIHPAPKDYCSSPYDKKKRCDGVWDRDPHAFYHAIYAYTKIQSINSGFKNMGRIPKAIEDVTALIPDVDLRVKMESTFIGKSWETLEDMKMDKAIKDGKAKPENRNTTGTRSFDSVYDIHANLEGARLGIALSKVTTSDELDKTLEKFNSDDIAVAPNLNRFPIIGKPLEFFVPPETKSALAPLINIP